jgi:transcriptional regulator with XRE-family HTH domain
MDLALVIRQRLNQLGLEQRDLALAAQVTESYVSQLLAGKKAPPVPGRTDIYDKMGELLGFPKGELAKIGELQRKQALKKELIDPPAPLFREVRELLLRKCKPGKAGSVRAIFEQQPFGEFERLVTQKLLDVAKRVAEKELPHEEWLHRVAKISKRSYEEMRVAILEFLNTDVFDMSNEHCVCFLDPLVKSWDIDLGTFEVEIELDRRVAPGRTRKFEFIEKEPEPIVDEEPGLKEFLRDASLSGSATEEEIEFLRTLRFKGRRPTPLYYYRELQNLRDPIHFHSANRKSPI